VASFELYSSVMQMSIEPIHQDPNVWCHTPIKIPSHF